MVSYILTIAVWLLAILVGNYGHGDKIAFSYILAVLTSIVFTIVHAVFYYNQCSDIEELNKIKADRKVYSKMADNILEQIKNVLIQTYPDYEKSIFEKITQQTAPQIFIMYPEIKANETIMQYVNRLTGYIEKVYNRDIESNRIIKSLEMRKRIGKVWISSKCIPEFETTKDYSKLYE